MVGSFRTATRATSPGSDRSSSAQHLVDAGDGGGATILVSHHLAQHSGGIGQGVSGTQPLSKSLSGDAHERARCHAQLTEATGPEGLITEEGADDLRSPRMECGAHSSYPTVVDNGRGSR